MTSFREIVESDLSDQEKLERIGDTLDLIKLGNRETAFLKEMPSHDCRATGQASG